MVLKIDDKLKDAERIEIIATPINQIDSFNLYMSVNTMLINSKKHDQKATPMWETSKVIAISR